MAVDQGPGERDALLLAAGELAREMRHPMFETYLAQQGSAAGNGCGSLASSSGRLTFSSAVMVGIR